MKKIDRSKVEYVAAEKRKGAKNRIIAEAMNATVRYVQKPWARFKHAPEECIVFSARMGRPPRESPTKSEWSAVLNMRCALKSGAGPMWDRLKRSGMAVPKGVAHAILREYGEGVEHKRKQARRRRMRHGRKHANSMRHTDSKRQDDGRSSCRTWTTRPASLYGGARSTRPPPGTPSKCRRRPCPNTASRNPYRLTAAPGSTPPNPKKRPREFQCSRNA